ncbi:MAG: HEAT repeat domain-containing protein, partial [Elusimicrobia bacterium]|nr:HEAT repeat domain-containing protein [Elusimicrobiota bacterium]
SAALLMMVPFIKGHTSSVERPSAVTFSTVQEDPRITKAIEDLKSKDYRIREAAAKTLGDTHDPHVIPALKTVIDDPEWEVGAAANHALIHMNKPEAVPALIEMLKDKSSDVRLTAVQALRQMEDRRALPALINALDDRDPRVSEFARRAVSKISGLRDIPVILKAFPHVSFGTQVHLSFTLLGMTLISILKLLLILPVILGVSKAATESWRSFSAKTRSHPSRTEAIPTVENPILRLTVEARQMDLPADPGEALRLLGLERLLSSEQPSEGNNRMVEELSSLPVHDALAILPRLIGYLRSSEKAALVPLFRRLATEAGQTHGVGRAVLPQDAFTNIRSTPAMQEREAALLLALAGPSGAALDRSDLQSLARIYNVNRSITEQERGWALNAMRTRFVNGIAALSRWVVRVLLGRTAYKVYHLPLSRNSSGLADWLGDPRAGRFADHIASAIRREIQGGKEDLSGVVLVSDVVGLTAEEVLERLREKMPDVPLTLLSTVRILPAEALGIQSEGGMIFGETIARRISPKAWNKISMDIETLFGHQWNLEGLSRYYVSLYVISLMGELINATESLINETRIAQHIQVQA